MLYNLTIYQHHQQTCYHNIVSQTQAKKVYAFTSPEKCHPCDTQIPQETQGCADGLLWKYQGCKC